jgi:hypothetical protein
MRRSRATPYASVSFGPLVLVWWWSHRWRPQVHRLRRHHYWFAVGPVEGAFNTRRFRA